MLANLRALFGVVVDIVLLRRGPEQLPASPALLGVVIAIHVAVNALLAGMMPNTPSSWPLQLLVSTVFMVLWFHTALSLAQKRERFVQTMTAVFATSMLFLPALAPLFAALQPFLAEPEKAGQPPGNILLLGAVLGIWFVVVQVRIVRSAFEWPWFLSILFFLAQNFVSMWLLSSLFATSPPAA
jgi:hypothetical protein